MLYIISTIEEMGETKFEEVIDENLFTFFGLIQLICIIIVFFEVLLRTDFGEMEMHVLVTIFDFESHV